MENTEPIKLGGNGRRIVQHLHDKQEYCDKLVQTIEDAAIDYYDNEKHNRLYPETKYCIRDYKAGWKEGIEWYKQQLNQ